MSKNGYKPIEEPERRASLKKRFFTFKNVSNDQSGVKDKSLSLQQTFIDFASALAVTFLQLCTAISFAAGCFAHPRTSPLFGYGAMMTAIATIFTQIFFAWRSDIPYLFVAPDGFLIPLIISLGDSVSRIIVDDEIFQHTYMFAIVLTTFVIGLSTFICGFYKVNRFSDYIPYPAICGLMAGIGINLIQIAFYISVIEETGELSPSIIPAIIFAALTVIAQRYQLNAAQTFLVLVFLSFILFYGSVFVFNIPFTVLYETSFVFNPRKNLNYVWVYFIHEYPRNISKVSMTAILTIADQIISIAIIMVLKISLTILAYEKGLNTNFKKSKELMKYGIGSMVASLFGAVGTTPTLSTLTTALQMGGSGRLPGLIAPLIFAVVWATKFSCVQYIPKFIFTGLLLSSGYTMTVAWLVMPLYRIPRAESIILVVIVTVYLLRGILFAMGVGSMLSIFLFSFRFHEIGCIKFISTGSVFHSTEERPEQATRKLRPFRNRIKVVQLHGYIAFSNSNQLLEVVTQILGINSLEEEVDPAVRSSSSLRNTPSKDSFQAKPSPSTEPPRSRMESIAPIDNRPMTVGFTVNDDLFYEEMDYEHSDGGASSLEVEDGSKGEDRPFALILHMNDVVGCDASAMDVFSQIARLCFQSRCRMVVAAAGDYEKILFQSCGILNHDHVIVKDHLDNALKAMEDALLRDLGYDVSAIAAAPTPSPEAGFLACLKLMQERYPMVDCSKLACFEKYCSVLDFAPGQKISSKQLAAKTPVLGKDTPSSKRKKEKGGSITDLTSSSSSGFFFLEIGFIQNLVSMQTDMVDREELSAYMSSTELEQGSSNNATSDSSTPYLSKAANLQLIPDLAKSSWAARRGRPGWVFEDFSNTPYSYLDRDIQVYRAVTYCRVHHISSEDLEACMAAHPECAMTFLQLRYAVCKRQLASATEKLSNLADVLHFKPKGKKIKDLDMLEKKKKEKLAALERTDSN